MYFMEEDTGRKNYGKMGSLRETCRFSEDQPGIRDRSGDRKTDQEQGCRRNRKYPFLSLWDIKGTSITVAFERHGQSSGDPSGKNKRTQKGALRARPLEC